MIGRNPVAPRRFLAAILAVLMGACSGGLDPVDDHARLPGPPRPYSPADSLKQFDASVQEPYRLGPGDQVHVQVWEKADLSGAQTVGPDGAITVPLVGSVTVSGMTRDEAARAIREPLAKLYTGVSVTLRIDQYQANRVTVVGRVKTPGVYKFDNAPSLLEALARAGGVLDGPVNLSHCAVVRGKDRIAWIDLGSLAEGRDLSINLRLKPEDLVLVPEDGDTPVYVLGQVTKPGPFRWTRNMTVVDALALAGGGTRDSLPSRILVARPSQNKRYVISQSDLLGPVPGMNMALEKGDIVYVPTNALADIGYFFEKLNLWSWVFVADVVRNPR